MPLDSLTAPPDIWSPPANPAIRKLRTAIWDIETDGLLPQMTRVHCLAIREYESGDVWRFRSCAEHGDDIHLGVEMLLDADMLVGHNILHFDIPALEMIFGKLEFAGLIRDTLVMSRVVFADQKDRDFRLFERDQLPGKYIGQHKLEAWGWRLGMQKGDYSDMMEERAKALGITDDDEIRKFVWGTWNPEMDDYCGVDIDVTTLLWKKIAEKKLAHEAIVLEHTIHDIMGAQERNGWPFDQEKAQVLCAQLDAEVTELIGAAKDHYGYWWAPSKKHVIRPLWAPPQGKKLKRGAKAKRGEKVKKTEYKAPRPEFGEDDSRAIWGDVEVPTKNLRFKEVLRADRTAGAPFCPVKRVEFNPGSRDNIIDRFTTVYDWSPQDFTETGRPSVDDTVLRNLAGKIPMAEELAEIFYYKKTLGMVRDGKSGWLKVVADDGNIHHYCNVGGTISGRAAHVGPNLGQVKSVQKKKFDITTLPIMFDWSAFNPDKPVQELVVFGREGEHGWECRELFIVPETHLLVGSDLSGIELRCLAELLQPFDNGEYIDVILSRDIHTFNQDVAGLKTRAQAKTFIYAMIYGGGDAKLGSIVEPLASEAEQAAIGMKLRARFLNNLKGFKQVMRNVKRWAARGAIPGLDGRLLPVRSEHSALNTKLQSDAALIAKKWVVLFHEGMLDRGFTHGWDGDFAHLAWVHDEMQNAARRNIARTVADLAVQAAAAAGKHFHFVCPVDAEAKIGRNWAETH